MKNTYRYIIYSKLGTLQSILFVLLLGAFWLPNSANADCSDSTYVCSSTDETITYGNCSNWKNAFICEPCRSHDWPQECGQLERKTWMKDTNTIHSKLRDITLPGAHDAGMGTISSCTDYGFDDITQTQTKSIRELLISGIRVFDIRPTIDKNGNMQTAHISWIGKDIDLKLKTLTLRNEGCYGYSMERILNDVAAFRSQYPSELIILELSHFQNFKAHDVKGSHFDPQDFDRMKASIESHLKQYIIRGVDDPLNSKVSDLTSKGGVLILMDDAPTDSAKGYYSHSDLRVSGSYANKTKVNEMANNQLKKLESRAADSLFLTSWTLTQNEDIVTDCAINHFSFGALGRCDSILAMASSALTSLDVLENWVSKHGKRPNVVYTDAANYRVTNSVIKMNE